MENSAAADQAQAQMNSIHEMVAALSVDYGRLEELREEYRILENEAEEAEKCVLYHHNDVSDINGEPTEHREWRQCISELDEWLSEYKEELEELEDEANGCESEEEARDVIESDALSVEVRSGWGSIGEELTATEFRIVLCTGGPHIEIMGELDSYGEPCRAWLQYADWGTGMISRPNKPGDEQALLTYASCFYFG